MKWGGRNFEGESDQRHHQAGGEKRGNGPGAHLECDALKDGRAGHAIDEAESEESKGAGRTSEEKILEAGFRGTDVGFVESHQSIKREASQLEPNKDHEQLLATHEEHQPDGSEEKHGEIFATVAQSPGPGGEQHGKEGQSETDDLEEGGERRHHDHAVEHPGLGGQEEEAGHGA